MAEVDEEDLDYTKNPPELNGVEDLSLLVFLEMGNVLDNLEYRYCSMKMKHIYTSLSTILVAVNPYERLPIYTKDHISHYFELTRSGRPLMPPHPFAVGARSNTRLMGRQKNQSVVVCGESGAGKTETTKLVIRYLAETTPSADTEGAGTIEMQIMAASPILEAFGNAKTILNNNSSRFGKFTKLLYSMGGRRHARGEIVGSTLETYLLEKSRVVFQSKEERNYHSFYFIYAGLSPEKRTEWGLDDGLMEFHYTKQGGKAEVPGMSDLGRFEELSTSLGVMRITGEEQTNLFRMTMGIMHLGNVKFKKDSQDFAEISKKTLKHVEAAAKLWGIDAEALKSRLTTTTMKVGRKSITKKIQFQNAIPNRDSIAKGTYEKTFLYLAGRINQELCDLGEDIDEFLFVGVLDVFGFENFKYNSLEQFCINFTNEKLQEFFNYNIIASEQEEYIRESVVWTEIEVPTSQEMIDLVETKTTGFFAILDSACQAPQPDVEAFHQEFFKKNGKVSLVSRYNNRKKKRFFGIEFKHYADNVKYDLAEFIAKNMEKLHNDTKKMFNTSDLKLVQEVAGGRVRRSRGFKSVTSVFSKALNLLMANLKATEPYFVRCVNPNKKKTGTFFKRQVVEDQLRCGGIIEALRVLKLGYPTRVTYDILYNKYHKTITHPLISRMGPDKFAAAILVAFGVDESEYELGLTKIFFRPAKAAVLDEIMSQADDLSADQIQRVLDWLAERRRLQLFGMLKIARHYDEMIRNSRAMEKWTKVGTVGGAMASSLIRYLKAAREIIEERKRNNAATEIQAFWKAYYIRKGVAARKKKVKKATRKIWKAYHTYHNRENFMKWMTSAVEATRERLERERLEQERREREERERLERDRAYREQKEREERERLAKLDAERRRAEEERMLKERREREEREHQERMERMRKEQEEQRKRMEEEARKMREEAERRIKEEKERREKEEAERKAREEEHRKQQALLVQQSQMAQRQKSVVEDKRAADAARKRAEEKRKRRQKKAMDHVNQRWDVEEEQRLQQREKNLREIMFTQNDHEYPEEMSSSDNEEYDDIFGPSRPQDFRRTAANGTLFMKHTGRKKNRAPQDRFVKVTFDPASGDPMRISWGSGSRHIDFKTIRLIAWGHHSPTFAAKTEELDPRTCFSIVSQKVILDLQNSDVRVVEHWVRGLRDLIGQSDEDASQLSTELRQNPPKPARERRQAGPDIVPRGRESKTGRERDRGDRRRKSRRDKDRGDSDRRRKSKKMSREKRKQGVQEEHKKRTKSLMLLQQDLFVMTTTTVFRNLEEDDYPVTQKLKDSFDPKEMYEKALANDVPWRQWQNWIHEQIIQKMIEQGTITAPNDTGTTATPRDTAAPPGAPPAGMAGTGASNLQPDKSKEDCVIS